MTPKFRALDKISKKMFPVMMIDFGQSYVMIEEINGLWCERDFDEIELMSSTGLKDKNGKEIFEGDIVKYKYDDTNAFAEAVAYDEVLGGFGLVDNDGYGSTVFTFGELAEDIDFSSLEVAGNIYERSVQIELGE